MNIYETRMNKGEHLWTKKIIFQAGFAFLEAGSVRSKNTTNILIKNFSELVFGKKFIKIISDYSLMSLFIELDDTPFNTWHHSFQQLTFLSTVDISFNSWHSFQQFTFLLTVDIFFNSWHSFPQLTFLSTVDILINIWHFFHFPFNSWHSLQQLKFLPPFDIL